MCLETIVKKFTASFLLLVLASTGAADTIELPARLDALLGNEVTVQGQTFSDFTYMASGDMPAASAITVMPLHESEGFGLRFQGAFIDTATSTDPSVAEIGYTIPLNLEAGVSSASLVGNPLIVNGTGLAEVTTSFVDNATGLMIFADGSQQQLVDVQDINSPIGNSVEVLHKMSLQSQNASSAVLSFVDQTFSIVPEPAAFAPMMLGLFVLLGATSRNKRRCIK